MSVLIVSDLIVSDLTVSDLTVSDLIVSDLTLRRSRRTDAAAMVARGLRLTRRDTDAMLMALALPIMIMLLFVYLFGGAINTGTAYVTYVVPGVLLLCVGFGAASTAVSVSRDLSRGAADRFRSMDVGPVTQLNGQVVASLVRNLVATAMVIVVALAIGFRPSAGLLQWLAAAGVLSGFVLALSWLSAAFGVLVRSPEAAGGFSFFLSFLAYPSSAMVPIATMPGWLQAFARNQPVTHVVESLRGLLLDRPVGSHVWWSLGWSAVLIVASILLAVALYRRRER
jgi:ABC-2 type transport system permease protein